jgi:hypothetical protein
MWLAGLAPRSARAWVWYACLQPWAGAPSLFGVRPVRCVRARRPAASLLRNGAKIAISSGQVRAARGLIGWSQDRLVETSGVPQRTLLRFELGQGEPQRRTVAAIRFALETAGVEFIAENGGGPGVRLRKTTG